ncbi:hypothetical protein [Aquisalibacillus elongatus]|uniref:Uncharacterized protein n=1 Tax=Aquisalibacillus elongatus TaxID=485577 RepID=A0A3N5C576_9BACI|nr:hypothetical protein [Aquisalibacillus elongatus]RPF53325.1 hypothetical protein EDC24_1822 [Aquisalibacillus elongatus]
MNKNDFRIQVPLWNIALWFILIIWTYGVVYLVDLINGDFEGVFKVENGELTADFNVLPLSSVVIGLVLLIVFLIAYFFKLKRHNDEHPIKMNFITFLKPGEFLEDDELLKQVTENATKRIYIFYSHALPLLIFFMVIFPLDRYLYVVMLFLLLIGHNAMYYLEIRKFLSGNYKLHTSKRVKNNRFSKMFVTVMLVALIVAIVFPINRVNQIDQNQQELLSEYESCLNEGKTATIDFTGETTVRCD